MSRAPPLALILLLAGGLVGAQELVQLGASGAGTEEFQRLEAPGEIPPGYRGTGVPLERRVTQERLRRAEEHFAEEEWAAGLALLDGVLEDATEGAPAEPAAPPPAAAAPAVRALRGAARGAPPPKRTLAVDARDEVHSADGVLLVPVADAVRRRLASLPPVAHEVYRNTFTPPAARALAAALDASPRDALRRLAAVARRYPTLPEGARAADVLVARLLDEGRPHEAARALATRLDAPPREAAAAATLLARAALVRRLAGDAAAARGYLERLESEFAETTFLVRAEGTFGREAAAHEVLALAPGPDPAALLPPGSRSLPAGSRTHAAGAARAETLANAGSIATWIRPAGVTTAASARARAPAPFTGEVLALGNRVFLRVAAGGTWGDHALAPHDILAVDARDGDALWRASPADLRVTGSAPAQSWYYQSIHSTALLSLVPARTHPGAPLRTAVAAISEPTTRSVDQQGESFYTPNVLALYDAESGKLLWRFATPQSEEDPARGLAFIAAPVASAGTLVAAAGRADGVYAVGFTPAGKLIWHERLYVPDGSYHPLEPFPLAADDGLVVVSTGVGLVSALDGASGVCRWQRRYRSAERSSGQYSVRSSIGPVVLPDRVLISAVDSDYLTAVDRETGATLWERQFPLRLHGALAADHERVYLAGASLHAWRLSDGADAWEAALEVRTPIAPALAGALLLVADDRDSLALLDAASGAVRRRLALVDPRLPPLWSGRLVPLADRLLVVSPLCVFALAEQSDLWSEIAGAAAERRFRAADLLVAERRYAEALDALYELETGPYSERLRAEIRQRIVLLTLRASRAASSPELALRLLAAADARRGASADGHFLPDRAARAGLELFVAESLAGAAGAAEESAADGSTPADDEEPEREEAARRLVELLRYGPLLVETSEEGLHADVEAYAADLLRQLPAPADAAAAAKLAAREATLRRFLAGGAADADVLRALVRSPPSAAADEALVRLAHEAMARGRADRARGLIDFLLAGQDELTASPDVRASLAALSERCAKEAKGTRPESAGERALARLLDGLGDGALAERFWHSPDEGILASSLAGSEPLPGAIAVREGRLRLFSPAGDIALERDLEGYPDLQEMRLVLSADVEEPVAAWSAGTRLVVLTCAGAHAYELAPQAAAAGGPALDASAFRRVWFRLFDHPLESRQRLNRGWSFGSLRLTRNEFPYFLSALDGGLLAMVLPDGEAFALETETGRTAARLAAGASPAPAAAPRETDGAIVVAGRDGTISRLALVGGDACRTPGPGGTQSADVAAGGAIALFSTAQGVEARVWGDHRTLWSRAGARLAFADSRGVWVSENDGALSLRSLPSGRRLRATSIDPGLNAIEIVRLPPGADSAAPAADGGLVIVAARGQPAVRGGATDLVLIRLDERREKSWETAVHRGTIVFEDGLRALPDGRFLLAFNGASEGGRWHSRLIAVDPRVETGDAAIRELVRREIRGKGTGQPPRLAVLAGALALGNADGFGVFDVAGSGEPDPQDDQLQGERP